MLDKIFGNKTAEKIMLHIYHYGDTYPSAIARDYNIALTPIQNQLQRFEEAGVLISKMVGRTRVYKFNKRYSLTGPFIKLVKIVYDALSLEDKEKIFKKRRRPRRKGKPVKRR